jgi:hypothetical protein
MRIAPLLFLLVFPAHAEPLRVLDSHGPMASSPLHDNETMSLLLGGVLTRSDEDNYLRAMNSGADPAKIPGPERLHRADLNLSGLVSSIKTVLALPGFHLNEPSVFQPLNSPISFLVAVRGPNKAAEACRKKGESLRSCSTYLDEKELILATSADSGATWEVKAVVMSAKESPDASAPVSASALYVKGELWIYFATAKQSFMKENLFRVRVSLEGSRLAAPEPVTIRGFTAGTSLENPQVVRLKCPSEKTAFTLVANTRAQTALPLYWSDDGLAFRKAADSLVNSANLLYSPTQLPGPASVEECNADTLTGVTTRRDLSWAEKTGPTGWQLRRQRVELRFP